MREARKTSAPRQSVKASRIEAVPLSRRAALLRLGRYRIDIGCPDNGSNIPADLCSRVFNRPVSGGTLTTDFGVVGELLEKLTIFSPVFP